MLGVLFVVNSLTTRQPYGADVEALLRSCTIQDNAISPVGIVEPDSTLVSEFYRRGALYLAQVQYNDAVPRMIRTNELSVFELARAFGVGSFEALQDIFFQHTPQRTSNVAQLDRIPNRSHVGRAAHNFAPWSPDAGPPPVVHVRPHVNHIVLADQLQPSGPDVDAGLGDADVEALPPVDNRLADIMLQFPLDVISRGPNPRDRYRSSYLTLTIEERRVATIELFKSTDLSILFNEVQVLALKEGLWRSTVFDRYFPRKNDSTTVRQGFLQCHYYTDWKSIMRSVQTMADADTLREEVWLWFREIKWLPCATDKMWTTAARTSASGKQPWRYYPPVSSPATPPKVPMVHLYFNDRLTGLPPSLPINERKVHPDTDRVGDMDEE